MCSISIAWEHPDDSICAASICGNAPGIDDDEKNDDQLWFPKPCDHATTFLSDQVDGDKHDDHKRLMCLNLFVVLDAPMLFVVVCLRTSVAKRGQMMSQNDGRDTMLEDVCIHSKSHLEE